MVDLMAGHSIPATHMYIRGKSHSSYSNVTITLFFQTGCYKAFESYLYKEKCYTE